MERSYPFLAQHSLDDLEYERRTRGEPDRAAAAVELLPARKPPRRACAKRTKSASCHTVTSLTRTCSSTATATLPPIRFPESAIRLPTLASLLTSIHRLRASSREHERSPRPP